MNENWYTYVEDYNLGRLASSKLTQFEAALSADPALAAAVQEHRMLWEAQEMLVSQQLRAQIRQKFAEQPPPPQQHTRRWVWILAALLLCGGATLVLWLNTPAQGVPQETITPPPPQIAPPPPVAPQQIPSLPANQAPDEPIAQKPATSPYRQLAMAAYEPLEVTEVRGGSDTDTLIMAAAAFAQKDYRRVLALLATLPQDNREESLSLRAHAHFITGKYAAAARDFKALETNGIYRRDGEWYGLLARMATGGVDKATLQKQIAAIVVQPTHPHRTAAEKLGEGL